MTEDIRMEARKIINRADYIDVNMNGQRTGNFDEFKLVAMTEFMEYAIEAHDSGVSFSATYAKGRCLVFYPMFIELSMRGLRQHIMWSNLDQIELTMKEVIIRTKDGGDIRLAR